LSRPLRTSADAVFCHFLVGTSYGGLFLLVLATFMTPVSMTQIPFQKQLVGSFFEIICLLGIVAGVSPSRCLAFLFWRSHRSPLKYPDDAMRTELAFRGHHPSCTHFSAHILQLGDKTYCAGCAGMVVGAIIALFGSAVYSFAGFQVGENATILFWLGFLGVACGFLQFYLFDLKSRTIRIFLNTSFVLGAFLLLIGIDGKTGNLVLESYLLTLIVYWIVTRITLSKRRHREICAACGSRSCGYPR